MKKTEKAFRFLVNAFKKGPSPKLKKYAIITLVYLVVEMLEKYNLQDFSEKFGNCYLQFEKQRIENEELPEEDQNSSFAGFTDAARADSVADLSFRHKFFQEQVLLCLPELVLKDPDRGYSEEQRLAVFIRDEGTCKKCGKKCKESDFHVDHIKAHCKGGPTRLSNAMLLCPSCNLKKGKKVRATT